MTGSRDVASTSAQDGYGSLVVEPLLPGQTRHESSMTPMRGLRPADIRKANRELVLALLARDGPASRVTLALQTGLSRVTVGAIVADLLRDGCLREDGSVPPSRAGGRRSTLLCLNERPIELSGEQSLQSWIEHTPQEHTPHK
jgi:hypothetical protein